jgi:hypothetical protein
MIEKAVLMALIICRNQVTARCDPCVATIARYASASDSGVAKALCSLDEKGFVRRVRRYADGSLAPEHGEKLEKPLGSTAYELTLPIGTAPSGVGTAPRALGVLHPVGKGTAPGGDKLPIGTTNAELPTKKRRSRQAVPSGDVARVFEAWKQILAPLKYQRPTELTNERQRAIDKALKTHSADDLVLAIKGVRKSQFHCGENDRGEKYIDLTTIFKADKIDGHIARATQPIAPKHVNGAVLVQRPAAPGEYDWKETAK